MLETVTLDTFAHHLGATFAVRLPADANIELRLVEATPLGTQKRGALTGAGGRAPFSLIFRGPASPVLPQHVYSLAHAAIGPLEIFIVPIGPDNEGMRYQAVFT